MTEKPNNIVPLTPKALSAMEEFLQEHERELLTILFTDLVDSTQLQSDLGNAEAGRLVQMHRRLVREELEKHNSREVEWAGDSCLAVFSMPSDGVRFALTMQATMRNARETEPNLPHVRVGLHLGEIFVHKHNDGGKNTEDLFGLQVSEASRVMSLARGDQIYMSRPVYDNARSAMKGQPIESVGDVQWINHGPYILKGSEEQVEICEVGEQGHAPLTPPEPNDKCQPASASREVKVITPEIVTPLGASKRSPLTLVLAVALTALICVAITAFMLRPDPPVPAAVQRFTIAPDSDESMLMASGVPGPVAVSPDGQRMVFLAGATPTEARIFIRSIDRHDVRPLAGTGGATAPFFSPDGQWIAFFAGQKLKKVSVNGGAVLTLCDASLSARGGSWGPDDMIVYAPSSTEGLYTIPAVGGEPRQLTTLDEEAGELSHRFPDFLPGGKAVLFTNKTAINLDQADLNVLLLETGEIHTVLSGGFNARYVSSGHVVFGHAGTLMAFPFDLETLQHTGPPGPVINDVLTSGSMGSVAYGVSTDGLLVYSEGGSEGLEGSSAEWVSQDGTTEPITLPRDIYSMPRLSPDGSRLALTLFSIDSNDRDLWIYDLGRTTLTRLTFEGDNRNPHWTPDGNRIVFGSDRDNSVTNLYWKPADGSGPAERLHASQETEYPFDVSPDGSRVVFGRTTGGSIDLWVLPMEDDREPQPFVQSQFTDVVAEFSPNGRWIAYISNDSGRMEVYVRPYPGPGGKWQISRDGGIDPVWSPDGKTLYFRNGSKFMGVSVEIEDVFSARTPELVFEGVYFDRNGRQYDISPDGTRFLVLTTTTGEATGTPTFRVVTNWFTELEQLVPTGGK